MSAPSVSIILTSFRRPQLIREAIASVLAQTYPGWELIVVDDNSGPDTWRVVVEMMQRDPRIQFHATRVLDTDRLKQCRYSVCINLGLKLAAGTFITYLTDDDLYRPRRLERMVAILEDPTIMVVYGQQEISRWSESEHRWVKEGPRSMPGRTRAPECRIDHCSVMHRRACLDWLEAPYWPEGPEHWGAADAGFWGKLAAHWDFVPIHEVLDEHRWHPEAIQSRMIAGQPPIYSGAI